MSKNAVERKVEIKLGNVVYQVEREFVGKTSPKDLLIGLLTERNTRHAQERLGKKTGKDLIDNRSVL